MSSDRSTLEGKDRAELTVIAEAMGAKVGSRMRKAQIIDLIVGSPAEADETAQQTEPSSADADTADAGESADAADGDTADEPAPEGRSRISLRRDRGGSSDNTKNGSSSDDQGQTAKRADGSADRADDDSRDSSDTASNDRGNKGGGAANEGSNDNDAGNKRRRRRRGRDRDELNWEGEPVQVDGHLDLRSDGYGFLRVSGGIPSRDDCYVPVKMVREFGLRSGDRIRGTSRPAARNEKNPALLSVDAVNERDPDEARSRPNFDDLTPIFPDQMLRLERATTPADLTARVIDLVAPIGKGQRGLIVAPPKAGKTTVIKEIVRSLEANHPDVRIIVLLIDERPEEVTDMKRWLKGESSEVIASTFDRPTDEHIMVAEMAGERARRMVESGDDVCIVMDGITRLARAYNLSGRFSGRTMSGGVDAGALYPAKKLFGSARNLEEGGSLTILATALVETGSRMDEVIFEEFKGTGNMELRLDRRAAEKRLFPAVDVAASSTRHDELLLEMKDHGATTKLRRVLDAVGDDGDRTIAALDLLLDRVGATKTNADFLTEVAKAK